jgi:ribosomal protein S18 acetylase RimI-like enzyme
MADEGRAEPPTMTTDTSSPRPRARKAAAPAAPAPELRIRTVKAGDLPAVVALDATVTGLHKAAYWQRVFRRYGINGQGQRHFLVAVLDERVCGFAIGEVRDWEFGAPPCGWLFAIDVVPSARQQGVGGRLLAELAQRFRREGVHTLRTMTASDNSLIQSFFRSQGMRAGHLLPLEMDIEAEAPPPAAAGRPRR